jgi:hypothetical protein
MKLANPDVPDLALRWKGALRKFEAQLVALNN